MITGVSLERLRRSRGYVLIAAFIVATLIETLVHWHAPPDAIFMTVVAASIYLSFEIGLFFARFLPKR